MADARQCRGCGGVHDPLLRCEVARRIREMKEGADRAAAAREREAKQASKQASLEQASVDAARSKHERGGYARAARLSPERRLEIARRASLARWGRVS